MNLWWVEILQEFSIGMKLFNNMSCLSCKIADNKPWSYNSMMQDPMLHELFLTSVGNRLTMTVILFHPINTTGVKRNIIYVTVQYPPRALMEVELGQELIKINRATFHEPFWTIGFCQWDVVVNHALMLMVDTSVLFSVPTHKITQDI